MALKDPARRRCLPLEDWPAPDRAAWEALFAKRGRLADAGLGRHWAPATRRTRRNCYARWLRWLQAEGGLDPRLAPAARATADALRGFAEALRDQVASETAASTMSGLRATLRAMHPEKDWRGLSDLVNLLKGWAEPSRDRSAAIRPIEEIHAASARELDRLTVAGLPASLDDRLACRDMLIVLVLSAAPVRIGNLAAIEIGRHLVRSGGRTMLRFADAETKNRQRLSFELPRHVEPYLTFYLERVRPSLRPAPDCRRLWIGIKGRPLGARTLHERVVLATKRLFGTPINPHGFRACAATSFALRSPAMARRAAPLLGHRHFSTTEKHYVKASQLEASRSVNAALRELRGGPRKGRRAGRS